MTILKLSAKKPELQEPRCKMLLYADSGVGKTHFCCSLPETYYIDSENLLRYPHFIKMILDNGGDHTNKTEMVDIINEVKALISIKHHYKNLVIDGITVPFNWLSQLEAERLAKGDKEGTEYGANFAKAKRLIFQLGILLDRLDMNVFVTAQEKTKYLDGKDAGKIYDVNDKLEYMLGICANLQVHGNARRLFIKKSRGPEFQKNQIVDFDDGYQVLRKAFGEEIFLRESKVEEFATSTQLKLFKHLVSLLNVPPEIVQKWIINSKSHSIEEMNSKCIQKYIDHLQAKIQNIEEEEDVVDKGVIFKGNNLTESPNISPAN